MWVSLRSKDSLPVDIPGLKAQFDPGVPTYLPDAFWNSLAPLGLFERIDSFDKAQVGAAGRPVFVSFPHNPDLLDGLVEAAKVLRVAYPTCPIVGHVHVALLDKFTAAMPWVQFVDAPLKPGAAYRSYNAAPKAHPHHFSPLHIASWPKAVLYSMAWEIFDPQNPLDPSVCVFHERPKPSRANGEKAGRKQGGEPSVPSTNSKTKLNAGIIKRFLSRE